MLVPGEMFRWEVSWMGWDYQSNCFCIYLSIFLSFFDYSTRLSALYSLPPTLYSLFSLLSAFYSPLFALCFLSISLSLSLSLALPISLHAFHISLVRTMNKMTVTTSAHIRCNHRGYNVQYETSLHCNLICSPNQYDLL